MEIKNLENWRKDRKKKIFGIISINLSFAILIGLSYYLSVDNIFVKQIVGIDLLLLAICVSLLTLILIISKCFSGKYKFAKNLENDTVSDIELISVSGDTAKIKVLYKNGKEEETERYCSFVLGIETQYYDATKGYIYMPLH